MSRPFDGRWPDEKIQAFIRLIRQGVSRQDVCQRMGITVGQFAGKLDRLNKAGCELPRNGGKGGALSDPAAEARRIERIKAALATRRAKATADVPQAPAAAFVPPPASPPEVPPLPGLQLHQVNARWITPEWPAEKIVRLWNLWTSGDVSATKIAGELKTSKSAVLGKARRIGLPERPSPIIRSEDGPKAPEIPRASLTTLPPLRSGANTALPVESKPFGRVTQCCWPIGEPGTHSFRFCGDRSVPSKPYCEQHASIAYVKVRVRDGLAEAA